MSQRSDKIAERREARNKPFRPPEYKPQEPPSWATYIPSRVPPFKVHAKKHLAYTAVGYGGSGPRSGRGGVVYKIVERKGTWKWVEHDRVPGPDLNMAKVASMINCAECDSSFYQDEEKPHYLCEECRK